MRKTHLLKTLLCTAMIIMVTGTTVMAGTVTRSQKVRGVTTYTNSYAGTFGNYCAASSGTDAVTSLQNNSGSERWYQCGVRRYNYNSCTYDKNDFCTGKLANGRVWCVEIARSKSSYVYNYEHIAKACASTSYSSATLIDNYKFTAKQYY